MKTDLPPIDPRNTDSRDGDASDVDPRNMVLADDAPLTTEPDEASDLDDVPYDDAPYEDVPCTDDGDDAQWEAFIPDEDERDLLPDRGDFWMEGSQNSVAGKQPGRVSDPDKESVRGIRHLLVSRSPGLLV